MVQARKLVWASLLAVGLWQFVLLGIFGPQWNNTTLWGSYVAPWLQRLGMSAPIVVVGVVTGCLLRPRRPERLAALIGAVAALPIELPTILPQTVILTLWAVCLPAAVAGWVGADYWRAENWERFWKGPGGAIVRGGLVVGGLGLVLELVRWEVIVRPAALATAAGASSPLLGLPVWHVIILNLSAVSFGAMVTALLVGWRPRPVWGAFAGSGIALALLSSSLLNMALMRSPGMGPVHFADTAAISFAVIRMVEGAAAGIFAGRWEEGAET